MAKKLPPAVLLGLGLVAAGCGDKDQDSAGPCLSPPMDSEDSAGPCLDIADSGQDRAADAAETPAPAGEGVLDQLLDKLPDDIAIRIKQRLQD